MKTEDSKLFLKRDKDKETKYLRRQFSLWNSKIYTRIGSYCLQYIEVDICHYFTFKMYSSLTFNEIMNRFPEFKWFVLEKDVFSQAFFTRGSFKCRIHLYFDRVYETYSIVITYVHKDDHWEFQYGKKNEK